MVKRYFWLKKIAEGLQKRSVLWLSGVRRAGKTVLYKSLPDIEYFDCELPRQREKKQDLAY
jgi:predicted AAA+ superfamily ATPase